jgi:tetratricopeptide (TPR) repeat protein
MPTAPTPTPAPAPASDPILDTQVFWDRHKGTIIGVIAVLVLAAAVFGGYGMYVAHREQSAARLLSTARAPEQYQQVIGRYPSSGAAAGAHLLLAGELRKHGKFEEANGTLREFIERQPRHAMVSTAMMGIAANLDSVGRADEALEMYRRAATEHPQSYSAPLAMLAQVSILKSKGQTEEARRVCENIIAQHSGSYAAMEAQRLLRGLQPPKTDTPPPAAPPQPAQQDTAPAAAPAEPQPAPAATP